MKISEYPYIQAKHFSKRYGEEVEIVTLHYTAGLGNAKSLGNFFAKGQRKASSHFGVGRDLDTFENGEKSLVAQYVDTKYNAWHAGKSKFRDMQGSVGRKSIGIEICNSGWAYLDRLDDDRIYKGPHRIGSGAPKTWEKYTKFQVYAVIEIINRIKQYHPNIKYVTGHEDIRNKFVVDIKGSKTDPGPAFPWKNEDLQQAFADLGLEEWHFSFRDKKWYKGIASH